MTPPHYPTTRDRAGNHCQNVANCQKSARARIAVNPYPAWVCDFWQPLQNPLIPPKNDFRNAKVKNPRPRRNSL